MREEILPEGQCIHLSLGNSYRAILSRLRRMASFAPSRSSREIFDNDLGTTVAVQIWKVTLKTHLNHALSAAASVAFVALWAAMFAGTIGINDIKEQNRTIQEHKAIVN